MTQNELLLYAFSGGEHLTVAKALNLYGVYALSQRCGELRRAGYPIQSKRIEVDSGKHVKEYWLEEE